MEGGSLKVREKAACPPGTSVLVRNLFYNTPGRRKFLKSDATEFRHILDAVQRAALSRPDVGFTLISDGETVIRCVPEPVDDRVGSLFGRKQAGTLVHGREESTEGAVEAYLGVPKFARKGRSEQYLFLNRRPIVSRNIGHAVYRAYEHLLEKGSFPFFILFIEIDPRRTDVNVHPSKNEVKFDDESGIYRWINGAVRRTLAAHDLGLPATVQPYATAQATPAQGTALNVQAKLNEPHGFGWEFPTLPAPAAGVNDSGDRSPNAGSAAVDDLFRNPDVPRGSRPTPVAATPGQFQQIHDKYIIVPTGEGVMIVDQHAAHERIIYEQAVRRLDSMERKSQELLFPQTIEMSPSEAAVVRELTPLLEGLGFGLKMFGPNTVILEGVPMDIRPGCETTILRDVIGLFRQDEQQVKLDPRERLAKTYSCKAAVKAGDRLNGAEMAALVDQLFRTEVPYVCPHGRPAVIRMTIGELDRRFGRTS
jgi:DNA mismatch repair protein MutL